MNAVQRRLMRLGAYRQMVEWAGNYDDILGAWRSCPRGDWLLWLALKLGVVQRAIVFAAADCARLALPFTTDWRPRTAIILAEQFASGDRAVWLEEVMLAAEDCREAALDAGCYGGFDAANAAYAGMYAAIAATPQGPDEEVAAAAAEAVAEAAADAAVSLAEGDEARAAMQRTCANTVRNRISEEVILRRWRSRGAA